MSGQCRVDGCDEGHYARGLCAMHYRRSLRHGDPTITGAPRYHSAPAPVFEDAACKGATGLFFADDQGRLDTRPAKQICAGCRHRPECAEWAISNYVGHGVWGGMSERERRTARRQRKAAS